MVIISPAVDADDADDLLAAANNGTTSDAPAAAASLSLFDVHGTTAALADGVAAGTWWNSQPPNHAASTAATTSSGGAYASSSFPPPPSLQNDLGYYAGSIMDTCLFPQPPVQVQPPSSVAELSYLQSCYYPQPQGFPPCFAAAPFAAGVAVEGHHHHQQAAAIAPPPELTTTGGPPRYADTSAVGVRFQPTDEELIGYLRMKYAAAASQRLQHDDHQSLPVDFFKEFDVYQAHPMAIKGACGESQDGCWYAFSPRDRKYRNGQRPARSVFAEGGGGKEVQVQVGFWKSNSKLGEVREGGRKDGAVVGRMTSLTFHLGRQPRGTQTGWKMKEYTIPENQHQPDGSAMLLNDWVACKMFYKERPERPNTKCKTDENAISVVQERERPSMHGKGEKDKNTISVGQKRPRRSRKSKKDKNAIPPVAVGQEEDGPGEAAGESVQGEEEDMPHMVVPAAHQASDYSEQDLCVEDYLVCDVAFAQQADVQTVP